MLDFTMFLLTLTAGGIIGSAIGLEIGGANMKKAQEPVHALVAECERTLPRDQTCHLVAVPREKK